MDLFVAHAPLLSGFGVCVWLCARSIVAVLPLVSERANKRAVRLAKAKKQS